MGFGLGPARQGKLQYRVGDVKHLWMMVSGPMAQEE